MFAGRDKGRANDRPGIGGRRRYDYSEFESQAMADLLRECPDPAVESHWGAKLFKFGQDPEGDTFLIARLSSRDLKKGETAMGQVAQGRRILTENGCRIHTILVALNCSGRWDYEWRPDLVYLDGMIEDGTCRAVYFRDESRLSRNELVRTQIQSFYSRAGVDLYLGRLGRTLDFSDYREMLMFGTFGLFAVLEREMTVERMHSQIERLWLEEGRGLGSALRWGFKRPGKFAEVDEEQWPYIQKIHYGLKDVRDEQGGGIRALQKRLAAEGCEFSTAKIHQILTDPIYVTGQYTVMWKGAEQECKPIELIDPVPEDVFRLNQTILALSDGASKTTPLGYFCLNGILYCGVCGGKLTGRIQKQESREKLVYRHDSPVPATCRNRTYPRDVLHQAVFKVLLGLEQDAELRQKYFENVWGDDPRARMKTEARERAEALQQRIVEIERELLPVREQLLDAVLDGETVSPDHLDSIMPGAREMGLEKASLARQLARVDAVQQHRARRRFNGATSSAELRTEFALLLADDNDAAEFLIRRQAAIRAAVDSVIVYKAERDGELVTEIEVRGPALPEGAPPIRPAIPHRSAAGALGFAPLDDAVPGSIRRRRRTVQTVQQDYSCETVCTAWKSPRIRIQ